MLAGNSVCFDFGPWSNSIDLVFVDGGHDLATVKADTDHSFEIAVKSKKSCILWHDYHNADYPDLTAYLDELSAKRRIYHIQDTMTCVWFNDPTGEISQRLDG